MKPNNTLSSLLGITAATGQTSDGYLKVDSAAPAGAGIVSDTIQYRGPADRYTLGCAQAVTTIYSKLHSDDDLAGGDIEQCRR
jgi:hypothetical protein